MQLKKADLTHGPITKTIFAFAIPLILGIFVQTLFNMADQIVLGQMAGSIAVASVGACASAINLVISFLSGLSTGVTVLLARALGARDHTLARRIIGTALIASVLLGTLGATVGIACARALLTATKCPSECFDGALVYITVYYASAPVITLYNFSSAILRVTGDTQRPLIYMLAAGILNVGLNIALCSVLTQKVAAVAIATLASQALGAALVIVRLGHLKEDYRFSFRHPGFSFGIFGKLLRYGLPSGINNAFYPIANLQIQANVNSFGTAATAGYAAAANLGGLAAAITGGFNQTTVAMVGQNIGAERPDRVEKSIRRCFLFCALLAESVGIALFLLHRPLLRLYLPDDPSAVEFGRMYLLYVTAFYGIAAFNNTLASTLNAHGYTIFTAISTLLSVIAFRPIWLATVYKQNPDFPTLMLCFTVSWMLLFFILSVAFSIVHTRYRHGKLKKL